MSLPKKLQERIDYLQIAYQLGSEDACIESKKKVLNILAIELHADLKLATRCLDDLLAITKGSGNWGNVKVSMDNAEETLTTLKEKYGEGE